MIKILLHVRFKLKDNMNAARIWNYCKNEELKRAFLYISRTECNLIITANLDYAYLWNFIVNLGYAIMQWVQKWAKTIWKTPF